MLRSTLIVLTMLTACTGFREASPGVFRSPQPTEDQLARHIERHDIKTVVCLRGGRNARQSARAAHACGAGFFEVTLSASRRPSPEALLELWRIAAEEPRPVFVHCRAGVDRTGLATALIVLHDTGDLARAREELALVPNGHLAAFGTEAMDAVLDDYEPYADRLDFPTWVADVYAQQFAAPASDR